MSPRLREVLAAAAVAVGALAAAFVVLQLWHASRAVPLEYENDALLEQATVFRTVQETGWTFENRHIGGTEGVDLREYPNCDIVSGLVIRGLYAVTASPADCLNDFFVLSFPVCCLAAFAALRSLGTGRLAAACSGLIYGFLPYHGMRGEHHIFLACYWSVPLVCCVALHVASPASDKVHAQKPWRRWVTMLALAAGLAQVYYAFFSILTIAAAALLRTGSAFRAGHLALARPALSSALRVGVLLALGMGANVLPAGLYLMAHGANGAIARPAGDAETFGLNLIQLALPVTGHRVRPFANLKARYSDAMRPTGLVNENDYAELGLTGTLGLLYLIAVLLRFVPRRRTARLDTAGDEEPGNPLARSLEPAAGLALCLLLMACTGGVGALIALALPVIRDYNRLSTYIGFLALVPVTLLLEHVISWARARRAGRPSLMAGAAVAVPLTAAALWEQTTPLWVPNYERVRAQFGSDAEFVGRIEDALPTGAAVYQLPFVWFPESSTPGLTDYQHFRGYLHSRHLVWSYGAIRGRDEARLSAGLARLPPKEFVIGLRAAGYQGLWVDRRGYPDHGAAIERQLQALLGPPLMERVCDGQKDVGFYQVH